MKFSDPIRKKTHAVAMVIFLIFSVEMRAATLTGAFAPIDIDSVVNLSAEGPIDWIHWGTYTEFAFDRKYGVSPQISDFTVVANGMSYIYQYQFADNYNGYSWSDGVPTAFEPNTTTGVYKLGRNDGFQFTVPADTTLKILKVYVGAFAAKGSFQVSLNEQGVQSYSDSSVDNSGNGQSGVYTIQFAASSSNKLLTVKFTVATLYDKNVGNVTLQAAALSLGASNNPPTVSLIGLTNNQVFFAPADLTLNADAFDSDGTITNVEFFSGTNKLGEVFAPPYTFVWSNAPIGSSIVFARATDDAGANYASRPVEIFGCFTGGMMAGSIALSPTNINLSVEGTHDWTHWGLITPNSFDRKFGVAPQISNFSKLGTNVVQRLTSDRTRWAWNDGTPTVTATNSTTGVFIYGYTNGFQLTVPADTTMRTVKIFLGLSAAQGSLQASLSDFSAPVFTAVVSNLYDGSYRVCTMDYSAATNNQTLTIKYVTDAMFDTTFGNVTLQSATLAGDKPAIALLSPTNNATILLGRAVNFNTQVFDRDGTVTLVEFFDGINKIAETTNAPFSFSWTNAAEGLYTVFAQATDDLGNISPSTFATVRVVTNVPPTVSLTAPTNNAQFIEQDNVTLQAQASDTDGTVQRVEFFNGENKLGEKTNAPYSFIWSNVVIGTFALSARATDDYGDSATSALANIVVVSNTPPSVAITNPVNGSAFFSPTNILITAQALDSDGSIQLVEFFQGEIKIGQRTNSPFSVTWSNVFRGNYSLTARARDNKNAVSISAPVDIVVSNTPPNVVLAQPSNGAVLFAGTNVTLQANASDVDGSVTFVEFFANAAKLGEVTNAPFTLIWSNVALGSFSLTARATDDFGDIKTSLPVNVQIVSNQPPQVTILTPTNGAVFYRPTNILLSANASDTDGVIRSVEFFQGTNQLIKITNTPYNFIWSNTTVGSYTFSARAIDNWFGTNVSSPITISISNSLPSISLTQPTNGAVFFAGTNLTLQAAASDVDGAIILVEFFESTNKIGEVSNAPFTLIWSNVPLGSFILTVRATDDFGDATTTSPVNIEVVSNQLPQITILAPTNGENFLLPTNILIEANASDTDGLIQSVEFFEGTNRLAEITNAPYNFIWNNPSVGNYTLTARAIDNWFGTNTSESVAISVAHAPGYTILLDPVVTENQFGFHFITETNWNYTVQFSDSFTPVQWEFLTNYSGDGAEIFFHEDSTNLHRFYRVLAQ